ncbi:hypothetical protein NHG97_24095 [Pseudomonas corrugata]|nr:hypothetical protein [Pseudomonas corrugata]MDU9041775.1 hypothetical protein [Pseudomonas corrugata]
MPLRSAVLAALFTLATGTAADAQEPLRLENLKLAVTFWKTSARTGA